MKNKYCWLLILFALVFIGGTSVRAQQKTPTPQKAGKPKPPPAPSATRSVDISSKDFENSQRADNSSFKDRDANKTDSKKSKYVRRCKKYISKRTRKTYWRCRNVRIS